MGSGGDLPGNLETAVLGKRSEGVISNTWPDPATHLFPCSLAGPGTGGALALGTATCFRGQTGSVSAGAFDSAKPHPTLALQEGRRPTASMAGGTGSMTSHLSVMVSNC